MYFRAKELIRVRHRSSLLFAHFVQHSEHFCGTDILHVSASRLQFCSLQLDKEIKKASKITNDSIDALGKAPAGGGSSVP